MCTLYGGIALVGEANVMAGGATIAGYRNSPTARHAVRRLIFGNAAMADCQKWQLGGNIEV